MTHKGHIKNGEFVELDFERYLHDLESLEGKQVYLTIGIHRPKRSTLQNAYYHGVIIKMLSEETGHSPRDIHQWVKENFLDEGAFQIAGKISGKFKSTTELNTVEFEELCADLRQFASETFDLTITKPNEQWMWSVEKNGTI